MASDARVHLHVARVEVSMLPPEHIDRHLFMSEHDPLCPRIDELTLTPYCLCPLLSRVRDDERERIAAAMSDAIADRVTWDDGSEFIAVVDAARIARSGGDR